MGDNHRRLPWETNMEDKIICGGKPWEAAFETTMGDKCGR
jgi:hypothetical protein